MTWSGQPPVCERKIQFSSGKTVPLWCRIILSPDNCKVYFESLVSSDMYLIVHVFYKNTHAHAALCRALPAIDNGRVQYSPDFIPDFNVGTEATYTCNFGFRLIGQMVLECEETGLWSDVSPSCEGKE